MDLWRAGCGGSRTSGSGDGLGRRTCREAGTAPRSDPTTRTASSTSAGCDCRTRRSDTGSEARPGVPVSSSPHARRGALERGWPRQAHGILRAGDPRGEVAATWHAKEAIRKLYAHADDQTASFRSAPGSTLLGAVEMAQRINPNSSRTSVTNRITGDIPTAAHIPLSVKR
jgi:hypothetical protein